MKKKISSKSSFEDLVGVSGKNRVSVGDYLSDNRVPVLYPDGTPAMPTKSSKAINLLNTGKAVEYESDIGVLCLKLKYWPMSQEHQPIAIGVDPGKYYTGIAVQSSKNTLLGLHVTLPVDDRKIKKTLKKSTRIRSDIKNNRECENFICEYLLSIYPISNIVLEVSKTKKPRSEWNPTLVGQDWQFKRLQKFAKTKSVDGVQTSEYRRCLNIYKQKKRKGEVKPETHVVDGIALASSNFMKPFCKKTKINCKLTPGLFVSLSKNQDDKNKRNIFGLYPNIIRNVDYPEALRVKGQDIVK